MERDYVAHFLHQRNSLKLAFKERLRGRLESCNYIHSDTNSFKIPEPSKSSNWDKGQNSSLVFMFRLNIYSIKTELLAKVISFRAEIKLYLDQRLTLVCPQTEKKIYILIPVFLAYTLLHQHAFQAFFSVEKDSC